MRAKHLGVLLTLSLALNAAFIGAWTTRQTPPAPEPDLTNAPTLWDDLELDPAEESKLRAHWQEMGDEASEIAVDIDESRRQLFTLLKDDDPDFEAIVEAQQAIGENQKRLRELVVLKMLETSRELDPEARRKWAEKMREHAAEESRRKPWRRRGHRLFERRRASDNDDLEELLGSDGVELESVPVRGGVELRFRAEDPEDVQRLHRELPRWIRDELDGDRPAHHDRRPHGRHTDDERKRR